LYCVILDTIKQPKFFSYVIISVVLFDSENSFYQQNTVHILELVFWVCSGTMVLECTVLWHWTVLDEPIGSEKVLNYWQWRLYKNRGSAYNIS